MRRTWKLAADPIRRRGSESRREIVEFDGDRRSVVAVVSDSDAMDVLDLIKRVYQDGREDLAEDLENERRMRDAERA
jgi:hypothetical protein